MVSMVGLFNLIALIHVLSILASNIAKCYNSKCNCLHEYESGPKEKFYLKVDRYFVLFSDSA